MFKWLADVGWWLGGSLLMALGVCGGVLWFCSRVWRYGGKGRVGCLVGLGVCVGVLWYCCRVDVVSLGR